MDYKARLWKVNLGTNKKDKLVSSSIISVIADSGKESSAYVAMAIVPGRTSAILALRNNPATNNNKVYIDE